MSGHQGATNKYDTRKPIVKRLDHAHTTVTPTHYLYIYTILGISVFGLCLELFSYTVMMSYNYTSGYDFLSYMEYPVLLLQEYVLIYYVFKYQDMLGKRTQIFAIFYATIATLIYLKIFPIIILTFLVVSNQTNQPTISLHI